MQRLVYYSTNRINGTSAEIRANIDEILVASRRNNRLVGLTGALMFSSGFFGQVIEGPQDALEATFERIQQDPRHGDVRLLQLTAVNARSFGDWSMAFVGAQEDTLSDWRDGDFDFRVVTGELLLAKLHRLVADSLPVA